MGLNTKATAMAAATAITDIKKLFNMAVAHKVKDQVFRTDR
jgi:hypothetical protein